MTTTPATPSSSDLPGLDESDVAARKSPLPQPKKAPAFIHGPQGDWIPNALWLWIASTVGRAVSVSEIEAFFRAPLPGGLGMSDTDADKALLDLVKYQAKGADAVVLFYVRGGNWSCGANRMFGLKGATFEGAQAAFAKARAMAPGEEYVISDEAEAVAMRAVSVARMVDFRPTTPTYGTWNVERLPRTVPRWVSANAAGCGLFRRFPSLHAASQGA